MIYATRVSRFIRNDKLMQQQSLSEKWIWITGASSGIGEALAHALAARGARLILSARREAELTRVQSGLPQPQQHMCVPLDITDEVAVKDAVAKVMTNAGRIDWLINNAGISQRALVMDTTTDTDRRIMEVDYFAQITLSRAVLATMLPRGQGRLVFVSSVAGLVGTQYRAGYSAAKAAIHLWANSVRAELYAQGIRVAVVFPGFVHTQVSINALTGDGTALGSMDDAQANAMSADTFAEQTVRALIAEREYIVIGGRLERLAAWVSRLSPSLLYRMIRRSKVR